MRIDRAKTLLVLGVRESSAPPAVRPLLVQTSTALEISGGFRFERASVCWLNRPSLSLTPAKRLSDGGVLATRHTYGPRSDSFVVRYDSHGCATARPLRLRALFASLPVLQGRHTAIIGATDDDALALIRIRR